MLQQANRQVVAGELTSDNQEISWKPAVPRKRAEDVRNVVVGVYGGRPVYLRDVAEIVDGAEEPASMCSSGAGRLIAKAPPTEQESICR